MEKKEKIINFLGKAMEISGKIALLVLLFFASFYLGLLFTRLDKDFNKTNPFKDVKYPQTVSVAINESNDILLMNRTTGEYQIYSDSVGLAIFKLYANKMYVKANNETSK